MDHQALAVGLGTRVRLLRHREDLTQAAAAKRAGISMQTRHRLERGADQNFTLGTLHLVATALRVEVRDLFPEPANDTAPTDDDVLAAVAWLDVVGRRALLTLLEAMPLR